MMRILPPRPLQKGERVHLLPPGSPDRRLFLDFVKKNRDFHEPWVYLSDSPKQFDTYLKRIKLGTTQGCFVFRNDDHYFVGVVNINNIQLGPICSASLGYYCDEDIAGQGLMKDALGLALRYGFDILGLNRIEANIQPGNVASIALVKSLGFRKEGFSPKYINIGGKWCDHERWAILAEEF